MNQSHLVKRKMRKAKRDPQFFEKMGNHHTLKLAQKHYNLFVRG